jgi:hypothetical protein
LWLRTRLFDSRLRLRLASRLRPFHPDTRLRSWRRSRSLGPNPRLRTLKPRCRRRCFRLLDALWPHDLAFRSSSGRLCYSLTLRLLLKLALGTFGTLRFDFLLSLLLLKLLHLPSRVSVPARRFRGKPGHLGLARRIVGRRIRLAWNLNRICRGPALIPQVQLLVLDPVRQLFDTQSLRQIFSKWRRRHVADKHRRVVKFLRNSRRQIYLPAAPG